MSKSWFFAACVLVVLLCAPSIVIIGSVETWELIINSVTTIVTFLLIALLQNTQARAYPAVQHKLNALAHALSTTLADDGEAQELRHAVGLEEHESS